MALRIDGIACTAQATRAWIASLGDAPGPFGDDVRGEESPRACVVCERPLPPRRRLTCGAPGCVRTRARTLRTKHRTENER